MLDCAGNFVNQKFFGRARAVYFFVFETSSPSCLFQAAQSLWPELWVIKISMRRYPMKPATIFVCRIDANESLPDIFQDCKVHLETRSKEVSVLLVLDCL